MKKLILVERLAHIVIVLASINCIGETLVTYGGPVSSEEVQGDMFDSAAKNCGIVIAMAALLFVISILRTRKMEGKE